MTKLITTYLLIVAVFTVIDMIWLMGVARSFYVAEMGSLMKKSPNLVAALIFYLLFAAGLLLFAVKPGMDAGSWATSALLGAALGAVAYGTYDFTNLAVVEGYGWRIALVDLAWGATVSALTAGISTKIASLFG
jgi:uncharacterized membrane protein